MSKEVILTRGYRTVVDDEDYDMVSRYTWHANVCGKSKVYAKTTLYPSHKSISLSRLLLKASEGEQVDHINGDTLDNRRINIRICTSLQNSHNKRKKRQKSVSVFKGVSYERRRSTGKKWRARITINNKLKHLGWFITEVEAASAYNLAAVHHFKEFACLNQLP